MTDPYRYPRDAQREFPTAERCHIAELFNRADVPAASIARARVEPGVATANHALAGTDEWYYILSGRGAMYLDGRLLGSVAPGDVVYIPAGTPQYVVNDGTEELIFLCFCTPGFRAEAYGDLEQTAPQTIPALEQWMRDHCLNFDNYAIGGNVIHEGYGLDSEGGGYVWYYTERGERNPLQYFEREADAVAYAFAQITADRSASAHCIGFTDDAARARALAQILDNMGIAYREDTIPWYGPGWPVYRTFVYGCDVERTRELKTSYYRIPG